MDKVILIKYGELSTKKGNRNFFIKTLYDNLESKLSDYHVNISKDRARMYIEFNDDELDSIKEIIDKTFGIHMYHIANIVDTDLEVIKNSVLEILKNEKFSTFKVEVRRSDKSFEVHSQDMNRVLGGVILRNIPNISVDVRNPDLLVQVEIREKHSYIYLNSYKGLGGYPVGTQPRGMLMLSGGIDSPVAGYLALKRGVDLECLYFESPPHTSIEAKNKVIKLASIINEYSGNIKVNVVPFTKLQEAIYKNVPDSYVITIMRRMMYRIAERLSVKHKCKVIINGESIGQVASQTLTSMSVINSVTNFPVIRPVACMDKLEIIEISKKINTYETSILPFEDCCTIFLPTHPVINPDINKCILYESNFNYEELINECIDNIEVITNLKQEEYFEFL